ncbi:MAG: hypothetical protein KAI17_24300 [Thiotrichaceae bacterium]|nr:hypothetical protein [Thiotrichaceae bacterium]
MRCTNSILLYPVAVLGLSESEVLNDIAGIAREKLQRVAAILTETLA